MKSTHCIHYIISQHLAAEPVDDSYHKCPMPGNRRVSDVRAPDLIRTLDLAFAQKIREFLMFRMRFRGIETRTWIDCPQIQAFLQSAHPFMIHSVPAAFQFCSQTGNSVKLLDHFFIFQKNSLHLKMANFSSLKRRSKFSFSKNSPGETGTLFCLKKEFEHRENGRKEIRTSGLYT